MHHVKWTELDSNNASKGGGWERHIPLYALAFCIGLTCAFELSLGYGCYYKRV